jgi:hypothetical protein
MTGEGFVKLFQGRWVSKRAWEALQAAQGQLEFQFEQARIDLADATAEINRLRIENAEAIAALKASEEAAAERASRDAEMIAQLRLELGAVLEAV